MKYGIRWADESDQIAVSGFVFDAPVDAAAAARRGIAAAGVQVDVEVPDRTPRFALIESEDEAFCSEIVL